MPNGASVTTTPTILIGLGGIGSQVVDQVYGMLPLEERGRVVVHAFDTNVNDIQRLEHLRGKVTQTSTDLTVGQYLHRAGEAVYEWFPRASPELQRKTLTEGAGQIRLVSRLAYRSAIEAGKLEGLRQQITHLFQVRPDDTTYSPRVMIVSSLAGGTGSGIFLQVAMYLRWLLETILGRQNIYVRGAFLLPDVLIQTQCLRDAGEHANVRTNGYACLKELDAIVANARAQGQGSVTIDLEFRPYQQDTYGRPNVAILPNMLPYDFSFLFDFENVSGHNLKFLANYQRQMAKAIYLQLFSPMAGPSFSQEDNNILKLIATAGRSRYCGAGVSTLCYPYHDLLTYLSLCWLTETVGDQWLRLDSDYLQELQQYERDLYAGVNRDRPKLDERYVSLLQNYGEADTAQPFFKLAYRSCHLLDKLNRPVAAKAERFLQALMDLIGRTVNNDQELSLAEINCSLDEGKVKIREQAAREVERQEDALETLKQRVLAKVQEHKVFIVNQALWYDCDVSGHMMGNDHQLNTWLLGRDEPLQPVAVRAVLYQIHSLLQKEITTLAEANKKTLEAIRRYAHVYDLEETEEITETASDRIRRALQQPMLRRLWNNQFKEVIEEYIEKSTHQFRNLVDYKTKKLKELVYAEVARQIRLMLDGWELFFRNLRETHLELLAQRNLAAIEHDGTADPTQIFVLASADRKKQLWEELRPQVVGETLPTDLCREIYLGQFAFFCQQHHHRREAMGALHTTRFFQERILPWCQRKLQASQDLNLSIFRALQKEAALAGFTDEACQQYVTEKIKGLLPLAQPFTPRFSEARELLYWGINPTSATALTQQDKQELFGTQGIYHEAFSPYEIICYRSHYGLKAEDFPKFSAGDPGHGMPVGVYFQAYRDRIRRMEQLREEQQGDRTVTPHLDKRWHLPAYLPDLNERQIQADQEKIDRALILGVIYDLLRVVKEDQREVWVHTGPGGIRFIQVAGQEVPGHLYRLHEALAHNPGVVDAVLEQAEQRKNEDINREPRDIAQHRFARGCLREGHNILEPVLSYPDAAPSDATLSEKSARLLSRLLEEINQYFLACHGRQRHIAGSQAAALIENLRKESSTYSARAAGAGADASFIQWQTIIDNKIAELTR